MRVLSKAFGRLKLTLPWVPPDTKVRADSLPETHFQGLSSRDWLTGTDFQRLTSRS